jgi:hypothetical protein
MDLHFASRISIRITLRLHDPLGRIEGGREFQFIVDLPKR